MGGSRILLVSTMENLLRLQFATPKTLPVPELEACPGVSSYPPQSAPYFFDVWQGSQPCHRSLFGGFTPFQFGPVLLPINVQASRTTVARSPDRPLRYQVALIMAVVLQRTRCDADRLRVVQYCLLGVDQGTCATHDAGSGITRPIVEMILP